MDDLETLLLSWNLPELIIITCIKDAVTLAVLSYLLYFYNNM